MTKLWYLGYGLESVFEEPVVCLCMNLDELYHCIRCTVSVSAHGAENSLYQTHCITVSLYHNCIMIH